MIDIYVNEIRRALKQRCYFPALALALTLPDICGMAEFPDKGVTDRYKRWYDTYLGSFMVRDGGSPYLSGEVVYNLRNTFLHQGSPSVQSGKVREEVNQINKFILLLGDGTEVQEMSVSGRTGKETFKLILVDVTYLCTFICDAALWYYTRNRAKFQSDFDVADQSAFRAAGGLAGIAASLTAGTSGGTVPESRKSGGGAEKEKPASPDNKPVKAQENKPVPKAPKSTEEVRLRCFFGQNFKEEKYREKRDQIIGASLSSKTKDQLNSRLTKLFPGEDVKIILQRLAPHLQYLSLTGKNKKTPCAGQDKSGQLSPAAKNAVPPGKGKKAASQAKTEHQLRCYFGQNFREKKFREKREDILSAVLSARSRQELNNRLTKLFPGEDVKVILQRFKDQIKDLPGQ